MLKYYLVTEWIPGIAQQNLKISAREPSLLQQKKQIAPFVSELVKLGSRWI